jgi:NAD-dependent histone deacetylase SIR2
MNMDLISAPSGENSSRTKPVVNLGVVDAVSAEQKIITDGASSFEDDETLSEDDVDSDNSDDPWETESLYEDALQIVRDDQLQGGTRFNPPRYR